MASGGGRGVRNDPSIDSMEFSTIAAPPAKELRKVISLKDFSLPSIPPNQQSGIIDRPGHLDSAETSGALGGSVFGSMTARAGHDSSLLPKNQLKTLSMATQRKASLGRSGKEVKNLFSKEGGQLVTNIKNLRNTEITSQVQETDRLQNILKTTR